MFAFIVLNLFLLASGQNLNANRFEPLIVEGSIVLPQYPQLAARAWITGRFQIQASADGGSVKSVTVLARQTDFRGSDREEPNQLSDLMLQSIENAIKTWRFRQLQSDSFRLLIQFQLYPTDAESKQPTYTIYRLEENPLRPPTKITIEYHFPAINK
jgi:hypothetical protein